jgi:hypothetical protein
MSAWRCSQAGYQTDVGDRPVQIPDRHRVIDPANPDSYLLGILLDGESYGQAKSTRDREIAQLKVLSGLGWTIHRIWSMDWWTTRIRKSPAIQAKLRI